MLALANVASAQTGSGQDQYVEQVPQGGGDTKKGTDETTETLGGQNGTVTEDDVSDAAKKNKKKKKKKDKSDDEGATGGTGAVGGSGTPPSSTQAVGSTAAAAKIGPFSRNTALLLGAMVLAIGGAAAVMHQRKPPLPGT